MYGVLFLFITYNRLAEKNFGLIFFFEFFITNKFDKFWVSK